MLNLNKNKFCITYINIILNQISKPFAKSLILQSFSFRKES